MESYAKVSVSELSQNLVPTNETPENKKPRTSADCLLVRFYLSRTVGNDEFRSQIQTVWLQGHVISTSVDKTVLELAEEPRNQITKFLKNVLFPTRAILPLNRYNLNNTFVASRLLCLMCVRC